MTPGGNPVTEVPGNNPRLPVSTVAPEFVTVLPASTLKADAESSNESSVAMLFFRFPALAHALADTISFDFVFGFLFSFGGYSIGFENL